MGIPRVSAIDDAQRRFASAMSRADNEALTLAVRAHADIILCDERAMRIMAESEGVRPLGTLGILLRSAHRKIITAPDARQLIDTLIRSHNFRIGIEVYQAVFGGHLVGIRASHVIRAGRGIRWACACGVIQLLFASVL